MTPLDKTLKRLLPIKGEDYVITLTPLALKVTRKGHQRGVEIRWESLVSGESALAVALQASVGQLEARPITKGRPSLPAGSAGSRRIRPLDNAKKRRTKRPRR